MDCVGPVWMWAGICPVTPITDTLRRFWYSKSKASPEATVADVCVCVGGGSRGPHAQASESLGSGQAAQQMNLVASLHWRRWMDVRMYACLGATDEAAATPWWWGRGGGVHTCSCEGLCVVFGGMSLRPVSTRFRHTRGVTTCDTNTAPFC